MPGIKYDARKLRELQRKVQRLASASSRRELNRELGMDTLALVDRGFATSTDPYGRGWAPPKNRKGRPLEDTGRLRAAFSLRYTSVGHYLSNRTRYASYHQDGTRVLRPRRMFPATGRHSPIWYARYRKTHQAYVRRVMGRGR